MKVWKLIRFVLNAYIARVLYVLKREKLQKPCYLIGGHNGRLYSDNAKVFYEYMLANHPEIDIYWVVAKGAPAMDQIKGKKLILGSIRGYYNFYHSEVVLFSDTLNSDIAPLSYFLPTIRPIYNRTFKVYLSHGTIAFKKMPQFRGIIAKVKRDIFRSYNLAVAATELEKRVMCSYGVEECNIAILGSARNDQLYSIERKERVILIAPTWRSWLKGRSSLRGTPFFYHYSQLLSSRALHDYLRKYNYRLHFYLHHMFHSYWNSFTKFNSDLVTILPPSSDIGYEIKSAKILITDYSSICADFYYLQKPILFFQFDQEEFLEKNGSEIDLVNSSFGDVYLESDALVCKLGEMLSGALCISKRQREGEKYFIYYRDRENCTRIYKAVTTKLKSFNGGSGCNR